MVILEAPYRTPQTTIRLPNPQLGDSDNLDVKLNVKRSISGLYYTHVKKNDQRLLQLTFILVRAKSQELQNFVEAYYGEEIRMYDWRDRIWRGIIDSSEFPLTFTKINEGCTAEITLRVKQIA